MLQAMGGCAPSSKAEAAAVVSSTARARAACPGVGTWHDGGP